jgi:hypothetical protein
MDTMDAMNAMDATVYSEFDPLDTRFQEGIDSKAAGVPDVYDTLSEAEIGTGGVYGVYSELDSSTAETPSGSGAHKACTEFGKFASDKSEVVLPAVPVPASAVETPAGCESAVSSSKERDLNEEFQALLEQVTPKIYAVNRRMRKANRVSHDFVSVAKPLARTIVLESAAGLSPHLRSVPLLDAGGVAGGEKFSSRGCFFKFAVDTGIYGGSDVCSAKAANRELLVSWFVYRSCKPVTLPLVTPPSFPTLRDLTRLLTLRHATSTSPSPPPLTS